MQKTNFMILGLPRSRTAWLANFMTYNDFFCMHEGMRGCKTVDEYLKQFTSGVGDSTTAAMFFSFFGRFKARTLIIDSDISDALYRSVNTYGIHNGPVYYQYCPMAIEDKGAFWLSEIKEIANPYFGDIMLRCGETRETIEIK